MWKRIYCNAMLRSGDLHFGVKLIDETYLYVRQAEPGTSHPLHGYVEVELKSPETASWETVRQIVGEALLKIGTVKDRTVYAEETPNGWFGILKRPDIPSEVDGIINLLRSAEKKLVEQRGLPPLPSIL